MFTFMINYKEYFFLFIAHFRLPAIFERLHKSFNYKQLQSKIITILNINSSVKMGICASDKKQLTKPRRNTQSQPSTQPNNSVFKLKTSDSGDIFERTSNPISNIKIITTFRSLGLKSDDLAIYEKNEWRKVKCQGMQNGHAEGICSWGSDYDDVLNGQSVMYYTQKKGQFLVIGLFQKGKVIKNQQYFKIFQNGTYFQGNLNSEFIPHGEGYLHVSEHQNYRGHFNMGVPHGSGEKCVNGKKFVGVFKNGEIMKGKQITEKGSYEGEFKNNLKHGKGILRMNSGVSYEGQFENNKKVGEGTLFDRDKNVVFQGIWKDDKQIK